jgi:guanylate kinase
VERGKVFIVSAPSGAGKSTLVKGLLQLVSNLVFSVSYTTREPRGQELEGKEYYFVDRIVFEKMIEEDKFVEYAKVFDHYYGTARASVDEAVGMGNDILLDIDTAGAAQVRKKISEVVSIFVMPPSYEVLRERLEHRKQDNPDTIQKRLRWAAEKEIYQFENYDYVVINDDFPQAMESMRSIVLAERCRKGCMSHRIQSIIKNFRRYMI